MEDQTGMMIMRIFFSICALVCLFCTLKSDVVARWAYSARKKAWNLEESAIPMFEKIGKVWNLIGFLIFLFLVIFLPKIM